MNKVEIIKIAEIFGRGSDKPHIMYEETPRTKLHVQKLLEFVNENYTNYSIIKSTGTIRQPVSNYFTTKPSPISGVPDGEPKVGQVFTINNSSWHTSTIMDLISDNLFITRNSVYLLYDKSVDRDNKLRELGI